MWSAETIESFENTSTLYSLSNKYTFLGLLDNEQETYHEEHHLHDNDEPERNEQYPHQVQAVEPNSDGLSSKVSGSQSNWKKHAFLDEVFNQCKRLKKFLIKHLESSSHPIS